MFIGKIHNNEWIGIDDTRQELVRLKAGKLTLDFLSGRMINIAFDGKNVVDEVYFALRDYNWGTIPYRLEDINIKQDIDSFDISFVAVHDQPDMQFTWQGHIKGTADSVMTYAFDGTAGCDLMRNRIGFCVLHPAACAGVTCEIMHTDGNTEKGAFPKEISPHQPFYDIKAITHYPRPGVAVRVGFEGDIFEMEDQRNWTDASFKTYCTPLGLPFPVAVKKGEHIHQQVTIALDTQADAANDSKLADDVVSISDGDGIDGFALGSCIVRPLTALQMERVKALELSHLRYDYHFNGSSQHAERIFEQARELGIKLWLAVFFTTDWKAEIGALCRLLAGKEEDVMALSVFRQDVKVTPVELLAAVREALSDWPVDVGAGTDAFFTQINRERLPETLMDFVSYSNNPQVHAFDNASIMSTVEGQAANLFSCRRLYPRLPVWVSPVTMKMRWNPDATGKDVMKKGQMPRRVDARQMSLFAASWFLRSVAACVNGGTAGATYFELTGSTGIMEDAAPCRDYRFPAVPDMLYPLYFAFFALRGMHRCTVSASATAGATAIVLRDEAWTRLVLANPKDQTAVIRLGDTPSSVKGFLLDEDNVAQVAQQQMISMDDDRWRTYNLNGEMQLKRYSIFIAEY